MRDGGSEGTALRPLQVDVDPLVVVGGVGELVDAFLRDLQPVAGPEVPTGQRPDAFEPHDRTHPANLAY